MREERDELRESFRVSPVAILAQVETPPGSLTPALRLAVAWRKAEMGGKRKESWALGVARRPRQDIRTLLGCRAAASPQAALPPVLPLANLLAGSAVSLGGGSSCSSAGSFIAGGSGRVHLGNGSGFIGQGGCSRRSSSSSCSGRRLGRGTPCGGTVVIDVDEGEGGEAVCTASTTVGAAAQLQSRLPPEDPHDGVVEPCAGWKSALDEVAPAFFPAPPSSSSSSAGGRGSRAGSGGGCSAAGGSPAGLLEPWARQPQSTASTWAACIQRCGRRPAAGVAGAGTAASEVALHAAALARLNGAQRDAATSEPRAPLVIVAGAGTGKTTTLLGRVGHLVSKGADPRQILLLTFSNNSADDIADRLAGALGPRVAQGVTCTTIHSFCLALLRCFGTKLGFDTAVKVAEKGTLRALLAEAWQWSALEPERRLCAKWLGLDMLGPRSWNHIFQALRKQDPDGVRECLQQPLVTSAAGMPSKPRRNVARTPKGAELLLPMSELQSLLTASSPLLCLGAFQYGYFFPGFREAGDDGRVWWAAPRGLRLRQGRVPKGAVLRKLELMQEASVSVMLDTGEDLPQVVKNALAAAPWAQVLLRFEVPTAPTKDSPAFLRSREDARWRKWLARAAFLQLQRRHDGRFEASAEPHRLPSLTPAAAQRSGPAKGEPRPSVLPKGGQVTDLLKRIFMAKRKGQTAGDFAVTEHPGCLAFCWTYLREHMRHRGLVDFDDLLLMAGQLLQLDDVSRVVRAQQRHILVDEFQDVSGVQFNVLRPLVDGAPGRSLCVVGDDDQTIYAWNGSTTQIFQMLREHCGPTHRLVQLTENYRSSQSILRLGHLALTQNERRIPKELRACAAWAADAGQCPPPLLWECAAPEDEAQAIAEEIEVLLGRQATDTAGCQAGVHGGSEEPLARPRDIAVLYRRFNFQGKVHHPLVHELAQRRIPYYVVREAPFWEQAFAQDLLAYLRLVSGAGPDDEAFERAVLRPPRGFGRGALERLRERQALEAEAAGEAGEPGRRRSLEQVARAAVQASCRSGTQLVHELPKKALLGLRSFLDLLAELRLLCATLSVDRALALVAARGGYCEWYEADRKKQRKKKMQSQGVAGFSDSGEEGSSDDAAAAVVGARAAAEAAADEEVEDEEDEDEPVAEGDPELLAPEGAEVASNRQLLESTGSDEGMKSGNNGGESTAKLPGKIAEAVAIAKYFAERWESPFAQNAALHANDAAEAAAPATSPPAASPPTLFLMCGRRLLARAAASLEARLELAAALPGSLLERLAADCGAGGRLQAEDFVAKVTLDPKDTTSRGKSRGRGQAAGPARGVCISTIHAAKGLEWPVVFVARWNQGFMPMESPQVEVLDSSGFKVKRQPTIEEAEGHQEEERRLAHVAFTRAQKRLVLTYVRHWSSRSNDRCQISSLPLPDPLLPEGQPGAAMWLRTRPKSRMELDWDP